MTPRHVFPLDDVQLLLAAAACQVRLQDDRGERSVVALRETEFKARDLCRGDGQGDLFHRVHLTTSDDLHDFVERYCKEAIARCAAERLRDMQPQYSAAHANPPIRTSFIMAGAAVAIGVLLAPAGTHVTVTLACSLLFFTWAALRLLVLFKSNRVARTTTPHPHDLPGYTVIVALKSEARVVQQLVGALNRLSYPREKLDIKLVIEPDDGETRAALESLRLDARYQIVVAPQAGPRTKPKALNAALPFARGEYTVIYDAEDRPDPDQLLSALECFWRGSGKLACVQSRLTIDNTSDSWLTRLFTAEYCGLFDVFLPALAAWRLPLPLGGSSNHFRTSALRDVGGWDPYNVTEDADLGMRLARRGYTTAIISSTTYEEAPAQLGPWLKQRSRWFKGWLQTWAVHMRTPRALYRQLGLSGFLVFQLTVGGTALAALVHPFFAAALLYEVAVAAPAGPGDAGQAFVMLHNATFFAGYIASVLLGLAGLARRKLLRHAHALLLTPLLWLLLSLAAWRGLIQLLRDPYRWEKTEHGLARTSRQGRG
jgi:cellulose synthase/poly-beta-1,6-N-acetylglucosamine synthase-like glycosyltransferase